MKNRQVNLGVVAEVAEALGALNEFVVFVGGAVVSVYADDQGADEVRPTQDVDLTITLLEIEQRELDKELKNLGFHPDINADSICTYLYDDISVDIMPAVDTLRGPTNRWYRVGFDSLQSLTILDTQIQVLSPPCFLATKFEAFNARGQNDYRTSHDFEDIIYVIDNRNNIVEEVIGSTAKVRTFLGQEVGKILTNRYKVEILQAHLHPLVVEQRYSLLLDKLENIAT